MQGTCNTLAQGTKIRPVLQHAPHLASEGGHEIDLQEPGFKVSVYHVVQPHQLESGALQPADAPLLTPPGAARCSLARRQRHWAL